MLLLIRNCALNKYARGLANELANIDSEEAYFVFHLKGKIRTARNSGRGRDGGRWSVVE